VFINPEYAFDHYANVKGQLEGRISFAERDELVQEFEDFFTYGMAVEQQSHSLDWMKTAVVGKEMTQEQAAICLKIDRTTLNRWLNGETDPPFSKVQRFYAHFGGRHEKDHPFRERDVLNLGGYLEALVYLDEWLKKHGWVQRKPTVSPPRPDKPTLETFLCLFHVYANFAPIDLLNPGRIEPLLAGTLEEIRQYIPEDERQVRRVSDLLRMAKTWGPAWLLCLTLLAHAEGGVKPFKIVANRPVRVVRGGSNGASL